MLTQEQALELMKEAGLNEKKFMELVLKQECALELMKEAGLDEKKFMELIVKAEPELSELSDEELENVAGGGWSRIKGVLQWMWGGRDRTSPSEPVTDYAPYP